MDHWASLATNLGAEPAPEEPKQVAPQETPDAAVEAQTAQSAPPQSSFQPAAKRTPAPRRPARPAAWDQLAGDLGIAAVPPPPPPQTAASRAPAHLERPKAAVEAERTRELPAAALTREPPKEIGELDIVDAELSLPAWSELQPPATEPKSYEPQEALDIMDETADEFADEKGEAPAPTEPAGGEAATEERKSRRRRRRRGRGRGREGAPSEEVRASGEPDCDAGDDDGVVFQSTEPEADDSVQEAAGEEDRPEGEPTERRGRRRHRGRGRIRDQVQEEPTVTDEEVASDDDEHDFDEVEEEGVFDAEAPNGPDDEGEHDFEDDENDEDGGESPRIGFRNIPTWQDAIGVMIAKNLESRSRNPAGSRGPGGRGGRGGRGRGPRHDRG